MISPKTLAALQLISERGTVLSSDLAAECNIGKSQVSARIAHLVVSGVLIKTKLRNPRQSSCYINSYSQGPRFCEVDLNGKGYLPRKPTPHPNGKGSGQIAGRTYMRQFANWGRSGWH